LTLDTLNKRFVLGVDKERLDDAPGFDKDKWPDMRDPAWRHEIHAYYGTTADAEDAETVARFADDPLCQSSG
jgi:hypothetical protein